MFLNTSDLKDQEIYLKLYKIADENEEKGYLPAYYFNIVRHTDGVTIGKCDLRIGYNENIEYGGNIGYEVFEPFRGNHYATKACKLLFILAKKHKMDEVFITCSPKNIASRKTCELSGGVLIDILDVPIWHEMYKTGRRKACQYVVRV